MFKKAAQLWLAFVMLPLLLRQEILLEEEKGISPIFVPLFPPPFIGQLGKSATTFPDVRNRFVVVVLPVE